MTNNTKPIIFNTEMVKAILDRRKTQTRRPIKLNIKKDNKTNSLNGAVFTIDNKLYFEHNLIENFSKYKVGDILYVKETWTLGKKFTIKPENVWYIRNDLGNEVYYKADLNDNFYDPDNICKWKPSIHMPKEYARIFLKVTNVRVERLKDISDDDCIKEGIKRKIDGSGKSWYSTSIDKEAEYDSQITPFRLLWNSKAKDGYKWEDNPYVFVYEFERIKL